MSNRTGDCARSAHRALMGAGLIAWAMAISSAAGQEPIERTPEYIRAAYEEALKNPCTIVAPLNPAQGLPQLNTWPCNAVYYTFDANTTLGNEQAALRHLAGVLSDAGVTVHEGARPNIDTAHAHHVYLNLLRAATSQYLTDEEFARHLEMIGTVTDDGP